MSQSENSSQSRLFGEEKTMSCLESVESVTSNPRAETSEPDKRHHCGNNEALKDAGEVDGTFYRASLIAVLAYCFLLFCTYRYAGEEEWQYLEGGEKQASLLASVVLLVTILVQIIHICMGPEANDLSGILLAATVVMIVALITNCIMAFGPTIVTFDKITNSRVFITRWCEWAPLAGLMTYLSEAVDVPNSKKGYNAAIFVSVMQSLSCCCAFVFPYCSSFFWWAVFMTASFATFLTMFPRVWIKRQRFLRAPKGPSAREVEHYDRLRFSYLLTAWCTIVWGSLVFLFFVNMYIHVCLPEGHYFRTDSTAMIVDTSFDLLAKALYLRLIVDLHLRAFSEQGRTRRQLGELRRLLSVLWNNSSDVILISVKGPAKLSTMVSPSFTKMVGYTLPSSLEKQKELAMLYEIHQDFSGPTNPQESEDGSTKVSFVDSIALTPETSFAATKEAQEPVLLRNGSHLIKAAWRAAQAEKRKNSVLLVHKFYRKDGEECHCEVKITRNGGNLVAIVRDVTERFRRFEAERRAHAETVARQKDAQNVNRFTRHEVKNGLLAGIELCDSLKQAFDEMTQDGSVSSDTIKLPKGKKVSRKYINDLDSLLHEVLDTVLAEAMARDVIHEVYKPRKERIDVKSVITASAWKIGEDRRFPLDVDKDMPYLMLDPQLIKFIYGNAVSNASKYGKQNGVVSTSLNYDKLSETLEVEVINEPGPGHSFLRAMGNEASEAVFRQGVRLHNALEAMDKRVSAGDGAWIMQKCAKTLGGSCSIRFLPDSTIFRFECPASPLYVRDGPTSKPFRVPHGTWGVCIDDSRIQRKLMNKILSHAGVEEDKRIIFGADVSDVPKLQDMLLEHLRTEQHSKFLVLVDENLDFGTRDAKQIVLSGSKIMKDFLAQLPAAEEKRLLVLVRSANDSAEDVLGYLECTHGFFPKAPMQQERVCELLAPLWADRFQKSENNGDSDDVLGDDASDEFLTRQELRLVLHKIDIILTKASYEWKELWSALHSFKGDIMTMGSSDEIAYIVSCISSMRGPATPPGFARTWASTRRKIVELIGEP